MADSDPLAEYEESLLKARTVARALGASLPAVGAPAQRPARSLV